MIIDYVGPALDTTILATGHMLWRLAITPGAYKSLRAEPELIPQRCQRGGVTCLADPRLHPLCCGDLRSRRRGCPTGRSVLVLFASASRDERHHENPESFDLHRNPLFHVACGHGPHTCVGMRLARLEREIVLGALVAQVERMEIGEPEIAWNNVLQGFKYLPRRLVAA